MARSAVALVAATPETRSQRARRERILLAAFTLASEGGYDGVQMREVAERADVALGTLYRYFPSKVHLLVSVMSNELESIRNAVFAQFPREPDARKRLLLVIRRAMKTLSNNPKVSEAMVRALMFADASVAAEVDRVSELMTSILHRAQHGDDSPPTREDAVLSAIIGKVWLSDLQSWLGGRMTADEVLKSLDLTLRTVLPSTKTTRR